ncbi:MAG: hypothetical protein N2645_16770 [Clostridia bacterium]|nr:hypothetical protein [Clostridia bacterium]
MFTCSINSFATITGTISTNWYFTTISDYTQTSAVNIDSNTRTIRYGMYNKSGANVNVEIWGYDSDGRLTNIHGFIAYNTSSYSTSVNIYGQGYTRIWLKVRNWSSVNGSWTSSGTAYFYTQE